MAGSAGMLLPSSSVIAILKVESTITTTLAPTSSARILEVTADVSLVLSRAGSLNGLRAALSPPGAAAAARGGRGGLGGTTRGGNEIRCAGLLARARRDFADRAFRSGNAFRRRRYSP